MPLNKCKLWTVSAYSMQIILSWTIAGHAHLGIASDKWYVLLLIGEQNIFYLNGCSGKKRWPLTIYKTRRFSCKNLNMVHKCVEYVFTTSRIKRNIVSGYRPRIYNNI